MAPFRQFFGHNVWTIHQFELGFSPLFLEYVFSFLNFFSEFLGDYFFFNFTSDIHIFVIKMLIPKKILFILNIFSY
jgi:hypothetical protein